LGSAVRGRGLGRGGARRGLRRLRTNFTRTTANAAAAERQHLDAADVEATVALANRLADAAAEVTVKYFRTSIAVESKADASPVTMADRAAEQAMRTLVQQTFPAHGVFGEEAGLELGEGEYVWVIDPIDGTKSFITGKPLFGTLIALCRNGTPVLGVIDQPVLKERWIGVRTDEGAQTTFNGERVRTRPCEVVEDAYMYSTTPLMFEGASAPPYEALRDRVRVPLYGCDCYAYGLLASGHCDLVCEADLKPYDFMALVPVVEGAGGVFSDWTGNALRWDARSDATDGAWEVLAAGDPLAHAQALEVLQSERPKS